jgi:dTDP-4-dehydrorhamnose reductase
VSKIAILGSTGMLGSTMTRFLEQQFGSVIEFNRSGKSVTGNNRALRLNLLEEYDLHNLFKGLEVEYVFNATGLIKQKINPKNEFDLAAANLVNNTFVENLNNFSLATGVKVLQIGTDCVYSGEDGNYTENDPFKPTDVYSITKSLGEVASTNAMTLRCSIIGKENIGSFSLLSWVLAQPLNSRINGFTNHHWNGLTTLHFSKIVSGIIQSGGFAKGVTHVVPRDTVSKYELVKVIAESFGRADLDIQEFSTDTKMNRILSTVNPERNLQLWQDGGYDNVPSILDMVTEYSGWVSLR